MRNWRREQGDWRQGTNSRTRLHQKNKGTWKASWWTSNGVRDGWKDFERSIKEDWVESTSIIERKWVPQSLHLKVTWKVQQALRLSFPMIRKFKPAVQSDSLDFRRSRELEF